MLRRNNANQNAANNNQAPANGQQQGGDRRSYNTLIQPAHVEYGTGHPSQCGDASR